MKTQLISALMIVLAIISGSTADATAASDYSSLNGLKGAALKAAVKKLALPHKEISYGDATWEAFAKADVRMIYDPSAAANNKDEWREAWFDMYSNRLVWVSSGHSGMNIEHAVANSWWGGLKNAAYKDLHHLNPSDADANNRKNNNPLGIIEGIPTWSNGLTNIGRPTPATGGGSPTVFEPSYEYKGDFARAYFYIFTVYDDIAWQTEPAYMYEMSAYPTLKPWAFEMLLDWASVDPVDEREAERNAAVAEIQENENPFVSIPGLAEYIWGEKKDLPFNLEDAMSKPLKNRPNAPILSNNGEFDLIGVNCYAGRWWDAFTIDWIPSESEEAYYSISDSLNPDAEEVWQPMIDGIEIPEAKEPGQILTVKAYSLFGDSADRPGSISTLTLTAFEKGTTDYMNARWVKVTNPAEISSDKQYIVVASDANAVMSTTNGSTSSSAFITVAGNVVPNDSGEITKLPEGAAVVELVDAGGNQWYVEVNNLSLEPQGFLSSPAAKKAQIVEEGMPAVITLTPEKFAKINFGSEFGTLQYNASSPRFSVYTSNQQAVNLYRCVEQDVSSAELPKAEFAEKTQRIFSLDGIELSVSLDDLPAGLYILVTPTSTRKIIVNP